MNEIMKNKMVINEVKNIRNTLVILRNINIDSECYESKILMEENIDNIFKYQINYEGENRILSFDVSKTISLDEYLSNNKLKKDDVCRLIYSIDGILLSLENYLVSENSLALDLKLIRVVCNKDKIIDFKFIAIPNFNNDFSYELSRLLIRVLRFIDVTDKEALNIAYGLFVRSSKENYTINDLLELVESTNKNVPLYKYDENLISEYDEELADKLATDDENVDYFENIENDATEIKNDDTNVSANDDSLLIDDDTKEILSDTLYEDFDKEDKKILKFAKKSRNKKFRKVLNAYIKLDFICYVITPIILIIMPILYYLLNGNELFMRNFLAIIAYEGITFLLILIGRIKKYVVNRYE